MVLINVKICEDPLQHCVICIYRYHREWNRDLVYFICILCVKEDWRNDWIVHVSGEADGNCNSHGIWNKITWWPFGNDYWPGIPVFVSFQYWGLKFLPFLFVCVAVILFIVIDCICCRHLLMQMQTRMVKLTKMNGKILFSGIHHFCGIWLFLTWSIPILFIHHFLSTFISIYNHFNLLPLKIYMNSWA